jgi:5-methyltetrahydrofolate--homocysteine methyltransferase
MRTEQENLTKRLNPNEYLEQQFLLKGGYEIMNDNVKKLAVLLSDLDEKRLLEAVKKKIEDKVDPMAILDECREGIAIVGERYEKGDYFVSDLVMSGEVLNGVMEILGPHMTSNTEKNNTMGKIVLGTVEGDIHNIGKDIVASLLRADGFEVYDLGVDVPAKAFVDKVKETDARMVGLSGLITISYDGMKATVAALGEAGLRDRVKAIVGGSMMNDDVCSYVGADGWGNNAAMAMKLARRFTEEK